MKIVNEFSLCEDEEMVDCGTWEKDLLYGWYVAEAKEDLEPLCVRAVREKTELIVLDSGADVSLLPHHMIDCGREWHSAFNPVLEDA